MSTRNNIPNLFLLENHQKEMIIDRDRHYEILKSQTEKNPAVNHRHQKRTKSTEKVRSEKVHQEGKDLFYF